MSRGLTRREFLKVTGAASAGALLAACKDTALATLGFSTPTTTPMDAPTATPLPPPTPGQIAIATAAPVPLQPIPTEFTDISYARIDGGITGTVSNNPTKINTLIASNELSSRPGSIVGYKIDNDYMANLFGATKDPETKGNPHLTYSGGVYKGEGQYKNYRVEYSQGFWRAYHPTTNKEVAVIDPNSFTYSLAPVEVASGKPKVGFPVIDGGNILIVDKDGGEIEKHSLFEESAAVAKRYGYSGLAAVVSRIGIAPDGLLRVYATEKKIDSVTKLEQFVDVPLKTLEAFNPLVGTPLAAVPELSEWISSLVTNVYDNKPVPVESLTGKYGNATTTQDVLRKELINYSDQYVQTRVVGGQDVDALVVNGIPIAIRDSSTGEWKRSLEMENTTLYGLKPFVEAMKSNGVATSTADILKRGIQAMTIKRKDGGTTPVAFVSIDPDPKKKENPLAGNYPLIIAEQKAGAVEWKGSTLRGLTDVPIGSTVSLGDNNKNDLSYWETAGSEFDFVRITDETTEKYWGNTKIPGLITSAEKKGLGVRFTTIFFVNDDYPKKDTTPADWMEYRLNKILPFIQGIKERKKSTPVSIVLADEPFYSYQGQIQWGGQSVVNGVYGPLNAFYEKYGKDWIIEAYVKMYNLAVDKYKLTPGTDFNVIGLTFPGGELPGQLNSYTIDEVVRIKKGIGSRLNIPWEQVPFGVGASFQIGANNNDRLRNESIPSARLDEKTLIETFQRTASATHSKIHITDMDVYKGAGEDDASLSKGLATVVCAAKKSGEVADICLYDGLRYDSKDNWWPSNSPFKAPNHTKNILYYGMARGLLKAATESQTSS